MKRLLLLLMVVPLAFAGWEATAGMAVAAAAALLAIAYMAGMGFGIPELQGMAKEEFFQLIALGVMVAAFAGTNSMINGFSQAFVDGSAANLQQAAQNSITASLTATTTMMNEIASFDMDVSTESSRAGQCSIMGVGYSVSGCGGYTVLATPLSMAGGIAGFALGELSAMKRLVDISSAYALTFLFPLGILLRTFRITRGAGGLLIALGVSLHIVVPAGVIFNDLLGATFTASSQAGVSDYTGTASNTVTECDPFKVGSELTPLSAGKIGTRNLDTLKKGNAEDTAFAAYLGLRQDIKKYLYVMMIQATLGPVLSLLMFAAALRAMTSLAGAEVDVSAITRFV